MGKTKYDWNRADLLLGTMPDSKLGRMFGIPTTSVYRRRRSRGIRAHGKRSGGDKYGDILGQIPDEAVARIAGVSIETARRWRTFSAAAFVSPPPPPGAHILHRRCTVLNQEQMQAIQAPFLPGALSADTSRGFELTSIKAAFVIERLNQAFGPCGIGWRYVHSPFEGIRTENGRTEIVTEVAFQYRYPANNDCVGCDRIVWDAQANAWAFRNSNHDWSEPIYAAGGKNVGKGSAVYTDARKSAVTDGASVRSLDPAQSLHRPEDDVQLDGRHISR